MEGPTLDHRVKPGEAITRFIKNNLVRAAVPCTGSRPRTPRLVSHFCPCLSISATTAVPSQRGKKNHLDLETQVGFKVTTLGSSTTGVSDNPAAFSLLYKIKPFQGFILFYFLQPIHFPGRITAVSERERKS